MSYDGFGDSVGLVSETISKAQEWDSQAKDRLSQLTYGQINWRSDPATWSVAQQLEHLVLSNRPYAKILDRLAGSAGPAKKVYQAGFWGRFMLKAVSPEELMPAPVPKPLIPSEEPIPASILEDFLSLQVEFLNTVSKWEGKDLNVAISSPFAWFVRLKIGDVLQMNPLHNERHLRKAFRVLEHPNFPK